MPAHARTRTRARIRARTGTGTRTRPGVQPTAAPAAAPATDLRHRRLLRVASLGTLMAGLVALGIAGCGRTGNGLGRLTVDGQVQVTPANGTTHAAHSGDVLRAGDRVQVTSGQAAIRLQPDGVLQLRPGAQIVVEDTPRLASGAVLVQPIGHPLTVSAAAATLVVPSGAAQLSFGAAGATGSAVADLTAKVYLATSHLDIAGNPPTPIAAPRQITLTPQTRLPVRATPLQYQDSDPWDHQYLSAAAGVSSQLGAAATGFNAQVPANQGKDAAYYVKLLPGLSERPDFASAFDFVQHQQIGTAPPAKPGDYLIASVIALRGNRGTFVGRMTDELSFSAEGAPWGFVAYDQGVTDVTGVLNDVLSAIGRAPLPFTGAPASQIALGPPATSPPTTTPSTRPGRRTTTPATAPPSTVPAGTRQRPPATTPTTVSSALQLPVPVLPAPLGPILNPLLDPLIQALNNILAGRG